MRKVRYGVCPAIRRLGSNRSMARNRTRLCGVGNLLGSDDNYFPDICSGDKETECIPPHKCRIGKLENLSDGEDLCVIQYRKNDYDSKQPFHNGADVP